MCRASLAMDKEQEMKGLSVSIQERIHEAMMASPDRPNSIYLGETIYDLFLLELQQSALCQPDNLARDIANKKIAEFMGCKIYKVADDPAHLRVCNGN